jgi:hypothetical protein
MSKLKALLTDALKPASGREEKTVLALMAFIAVCGLVVGTMKLLS